MDQPIFCNDSRVWKVKRVLGPYNKDFGYETPEHYSIAGTDGSVLNDMIAIDGVICSMWRANIVFIEVVKGKKNE